jgi:hypothetical protein
MSPPSGPLRIGWKERLDFPEWGLKRVRVKVDTGARTSALDAVGYDLVENGSGLVARLRLDLRRRGAGRLREVETPVVCMTVVRNTGGLREYRPVVEALVRLGPVTRRIRLTIASRAGMRYRMILGREALAGGFLVDVSQKYLLGS